MNIINLVGKLNFETDLKGADKFLKIAKQCNEQAKELRKNFVKIGDDEVYSKLGERAKTLNKELKEMKAKGYASTKTMVLEGYLKTLQGKREDLKKAYRDIGLSYDKKFGEYTASGNKSALKRARLAKTKQYLVYRTRRANLDDKIAEAQEELAGSKASDKATLQEMLGKKQGGIDVLTQAREDRKKEIKEENKLTGEKITNLKKEGKINKGLGKEKILLAKNALKALGRFTVALGIASAVIGSVSKIASKTTEISQDYLGAEAGSNIPTEGLQSMAIALGSLGMRGKKTDIARMLGRANWKANLKLVGQDINGQNLAMAGINPMNATNVADLFQSYYESLNSGVSPSLLANAIASQGLPVDETMNVLKVAQRQKISNLKEYLTRPRASASGAQNTAWLSKYGRFKGAKGSITGGLGAFWQGLLSPVDTTKAMFNDIGGVSQPSGDVTINKTININTNSPDVAKGVISDEMNAKMLQMYAEGGY